MGLHESSFVVNATLEKVWAFHDDPLALPKVMTGPVRMDVTHVDQPLQPCSLIAMTLHVGPLKFPWNVRLKAKKPMNFFTDEQIEGQGPFKSWVHTHAFEAIDTQHTRVIDRLQYEPPLGWLGKMGDALIGGFVMKSMFAARAQATKKLLDAK